MHGKESPPSITVVIPHYNGEEILFTCLSSLFQSTSLPIEVLLVDNASTDGSVAMVRRHFPAVRIIQLAHNHGFAGGCNIGIKAAATPYVLILNNDTTHQSGWLELLLARLSAQPDIVAVQPKILSYQNQRHFDYSGAAGGELDIFGFPFARGRLFETIECDQGQYDHFPSTIFWASGTAFLARREALLSAGLFDETFFAHMEEIDLQWRLQLMGYRIAVEPQAVIWHRSGATLGAESPWKKYLNHRNSLLMFLTNYRPILTLYLLLPRLVLDYLALLFSLYRRDWGRAGAILKAHIWIIGHCRHIWRRRRQVKGLRRLGDRAILKRMYHGSVALDFYLCGKRTYTALLRNKGSKSST